MVKRILIGFAALAVIGAAAYLATGHSFGTATVNGPTPVPSPVIASAMITAEGKVAPVRAAQLALPVGGTVAEVMVEEGQRVESGVPLVRLDGASAEATISQAQAGLRRAKAHLAEVSAGPHKEDVDAARAAVDLAKVQLAKVQEASRPEDIAAARASLAAAQSSLAHVQQGPDADIVVAATNDLAKLKAGPTTAEVDAAKLAIEQAKSTLWGAQISRDGICGNGGIPKFQCNAANAQVSAAEVQVSIAQNNLAQLTAGARAEDIASAKAHLDQLLRGPASADVANARAQVQAAQSRLDTLLTPVRQSDIDVANAEILRATAQLAIVESPARPETIEAAEADVAAAQATLDQANVALANLELKAPFAGVISTLDVKPGEFIQPGASFASLADPTAWQVETTDLTELNVNRIHAGQTAKLTFDAIPGLELPARVARIKELGTKDRGDILYTVIVQPGNQDERLRWNMTALVTIEP